MAERSYTVDEIVRMREATLVLASYGKMPVTMDGVEAQLRTYLDFGIAPADLEAAAVPERLDAAARAEAQLRLQG